MSGTTQTASTASSVPLVLDPALERGVRLEAKRLKKSPQALLRAAVEAYLEELEDYHDVRAAKLELAKGAKPIPASVVRKRLGLEG